VPAAMHSPIFIGGLFKSGTSLLRAMLGQHSGIAAGLETYWFDLRWNNAAPPAGPDSGHQAKPLVEQAADLCRFYDLPRIAVRDFVEQSRSAEEFIDRFLSAFAAGQGKRRWLEKTPGNILHLARIYGHWPEAKVIHLRRNPLDTFVSLKEAGKWDTADVFMGLWIRYLGAAERAKTELHLEPNRYVEVEYEELATRPVDTMRMLVDFVNEPWEDSVAQYQGQDHDYNRVLAVTGKTSTTLGHMRQPLTTARVGIWRQRLAPNEVQQLRAAAHCAGLGDLFDQLAGGEG